MYVNSLKRGISLMGSSYYRPLEIHLIRSILSIILLALTMAWSLGEGLSTQTVLHVPKQYPTIQAAIDAAPQGATILVEGAYKVYYENLTIKKSLRLQAEDKPVVIRGQKRDTPTITITSDVPIQVVLEYFQVFQDANQFCISIGGKAQVLLKNQHVYAGYEAHGGIWIGGLAHLTLQDAVLSSSLLSDGLFLDSSATADIINTRISGTGASGIFLKGTAKANLLGSTISGYGVGIRLMGSAQVVVKDSVIGGNDWGIQILELREGYLPTAILENSQVSGNEIGIEVTSLSRGHLKLVTSQVSSNRRSGIYLGGEGTAELQHSLVLGNGTDPGCKSRPAPPFECIWSGIVVFEKARLKLASTEIRGNAYWGLTANLQQCGFVSNSFGGEVILEDDKNIVEGNNISGKLNGMGNPGNHPFKNLPDGQVCLP
jgi:nitrous oxidase accessory protein NosD